MAAGDQRVAGERNRPTHAEEEPQSTRMVLCPCKSSTNPRADRDVFLAAAAQLSLLVSLRRRRRLLVYLQMLEVIL